MCHSKDNFGCKNELFINIPLAIVVLDELDLVLRNTEKLLLIVIDELLVRETVEYFPKNSRQAKGIHLQILVKLSTSLGFSCSIWIKNMQMVKKPSEKIYKSC